MEHNDTRNLLDFLKPIGIIMMGLVHFSSIEQGKRLLAELNQYLPPRSLLGITHGTTDGRSQEIIDQIHDAYARTPTPLILRTKKSIGEILEGWTKVAPGLVMLWRMELGEQDKPSPPSTLLWRIPDNNPSGS